jgi:hypothetical protein
MDLLGTAKLDLTDNDLIVDYSSSGVSPFTAVQQWILTGYFLDPTEGIVSSAPHALGGNLLVLFDNGNPAPASPSGLTEWPQGSGNTVALQSVIGKYTYYGDTNVDGRVTAEDYAPVDSNVNMLTTGANYFQGDTNFDGKVTSEDYAPIDSNYDPNAPVL